MNDSTTTASTDNSPRAAGEGRHTAFLSSLVPIIDPLVDRLTDEELPEGEYGAFILCAAIALLQTVPESDRLADVCRSAATLLEGIHMRLAP